MWKSKLSVVVVLAALLSACSSNPVEEQKPAQVTDGQQRPPTTTQPPIPVTPPPATQATIEQKPIAGGMDETKNPNSILSKRLIFFDFDSNIVKEEFRPLVAAHAKYVAGNTRVKMIIQGNTDERGGREYNLALGQRRSDAVKQMMTVLGADGARVESVSFGKEKPRMEGQTEEAYAQNRRAEIVYSTD